jgi:hypothetical protein
VNTLPLTIPTREMRKSIYNSYDTVDYGFSICKNIHNCYECIGCVDCWDCTKCNYCTNCNECSYCNNLLLDINKMNCKTAEKITHVWLKYHYRQGGPKYKQALKTGMNNKYMEFQKHLGHLNIKPN